MLRIAVFAAAALSSAVLASPAFRFPGPAPLHTSSLPYRTSSLPYRGYRSVPAGPYHPPPAPYHVPAPTPYHVPAPAPYRPQPPPKPYSPASAPRPYHPAPKAHGGPEYRDPYHEDVPAELCPGYPYCDDAPYLPHLQEEIEALRHRTVLLQKVGENLVNQQPNRPFVGGLYY